MKYFALLATIGATLSTLSGTAIAEDAYVCEFGNNSRTIRIEYSNPNSKVPCEVIYEKETGSQVLWSAENELGYCEAQAEAFVEKQRGWGWECSKLAATTETVAMPAAEPEPTLESEPTPETTNEPAPVLKDLLKTGTTN